MFTLAVLAIVAFAVIPAVAWALGLAFRILGWTMRMVFGVLLLPLWIVIAVVGGLAAAAHALIPIMLIVFVLSLIIPES